MLQDNEMTSPWSNHCWMLAASRKQLPSSRVGCGIYVLGLCQTCPRTGHTTTFKSKGWTLRDFTSFSFILQSMSVGQSEGLKYGNWWFVFVSCYVGPSWVDCMLNEGFTCILIMWFWSTVMSLYLTYGSPEASYNKRAETYFRRRSASLIK